MTRPTCNVLASHGLLTPKLIVESRDLRAEQHFPGNRHLSVPALKERAKLPTSGVGSWSSPHPTGVQPKLVYQRNGHCRNCGSGWQRVAVNGKITCGSCSRVLPKKRWARAR